ncbi:hypothetical protein EMIT0P12_70315 [Pseudomonas sp. IT-P12]
MKTLAGTPPGAGARAHAFSHKEHADSPFRRRIIPQPYRTPFSLARDHCDPTLRGRHSDS